MRLDAVRRLWERLMERGPEALQDASSFTDSEKEAGRMVLPLLQDLQSAREALTTMERQTHALEVALDHLPVAAIVVDEAARYLTGNSAARDLFGGPGVPSAVLSAATAREDGAAVARLVGGRPIRVVAGEGLRSENEGGGKAPAGVRILFLVPADGSFELSTKHLQERFGLSPAQGRVASFVAQGLTNKEIAAKLGISSETVHKHLASVFQRTGVSTRAALVALAFGDRFGIGLSPPG